VRPNRLPAPVMNHTHGSSEVGVAGVS